MSSEDTSPLPGTSSLPGVPENVVNGSENVAKTPIEVQADVHVGANRPNNTTPTGQGNPDGTEIDPILAEEKDVLVPLKKQTSNMSAGVLPSQSSLGSGNAVSFSAVKETEGSFVVQMKDGTEEKPTPPSPRYARMTPTKRPSLLRRLSSQESQLSLQESWRKKDGTTRIKSVKNYISFHNITYAVPQGWFFQQKPPKIVLNNVRSVIVHTSFILYTIVTNITSMKEWF